MAQRFEIQFCVPDGYEFLMAELYCDGEHFGELNTESGALQLVLFPRSSGLPWTIAAEEVIDALRDARSQLVARSTFFGA